MNERIKELAEQAVSFRLDPDSNCYEALIHPEDLEVFAELLIREYSYDVMDLNGAKPERVQYAAKCWGVEV